MSSSDDERPMSYPSVVWPWLLLMWVVVVLLFIGPFVEVGNTIGGMTGTLKNLDDAGTVGRDFVWLLFNVVILVPSAIAITIIASRSRKWKLRRYHEEQYKLQQKNGSTP